MTIKDFCKTLLLRASLATPGPWKWRTTRHPDEIKTLDGGEGGVLDVIYASEYIAIVDPKDQAYIATASPDAIARLAKAYLKMREALVVMIDLACTDHHPQPCKCYSCVRVASARHALEEDGT